MATVGVIGAGIAGLTAAHRLHERGLEVQVLEASARPGGMIRSEREQGFLVEHGPNSLRPTPAVLPEMVHDLGLTGELVAANDAASTRYVVRDGVPTPLPMSPWSFVTTNLLSTKAKLRLLAEPFVGAASGDDETVASFVERRLGPEILDYAVNPFVGGIFAGDPERLSVRHAFETLFSMERDHGSLFRGMLHAARTRAGADNTPDTPSGLFSFREGLQTLPGALADALGDRVHVNTPVTGLRQDGTTWTVVTGSGDREATHTFDRVICTVPLHRLAALGLDTPIDLAPLETVPYPPVSVLALGFRREDVVHPLDGFGMLVPEAEDDFDILGTIFSSTIFPGRAPGGRVLLTTFVGGTRHPAHGTADTKALRTIVERDLNALLGLRGNPVFVRRVQWAQAIPQYTMGHTQVKRTLDALEAEHPGLVFAGNYRSGVSVGDAMASGAEAASRVADEAFQVAG